MLKKYIKYLFLFFILSFSQSSVFSKNSILISEFPQKVIFADLLNFANELNRIVTLGNKNRHEIYQSAKIGSYCHLFSILKLVYVAKNELIKAKGIGTEINLPIIRSLELAPGIMSLDFFDKDRKIMKDAKKVAKYNKLDYRSFFKDKLIQGSWLTLNKVLPYIGFNAARILFDFDWENPIDFFSERSLLCSNGKSVQVLELLHNLSNLSEIIRKNKRYKIEFEYEKFPDIKTKHLEN